MWSGARVGKNICTFKVNESAVIAMHADDENGWLIVVLCVEMLLRSAKL